MNINFKIFNNSKINKLKEDIIEYYNLLKLRFIITKSKIHANQIHCSKYGMKC